MLLIVILLNVFIVLFGAECNHGIKQGCLACRPESKQDASDKGRPEGDENGGQCDDRLGVTHCHDA